MSQNVRIRRGRSSTASSVNRNLVSVTAPPPLFPPTPGVPDRRDNLAEGDESEGAFLSSSSRQGDAAAETIAGRRGLEPDDLRLPPLDTNVRRGSGPLTSASATATPQPQQQGRDGRPTLGRLDTAGATRQPPRARSRTINSIFTPTSATTPRPSAATRNASYSLAPALATDLDKKHDGQHVDSPHATPGGGHQGGSSWLRRASISSSRSSNNGVPVSLRLPEQESAGSGRRRGTLESMLDHEDALEASGRPRTSSWAAAHAVVHTESDKLHVGPNDLSETDEDVDEEHPAEVGENHHDAIVDHLDCIDPTVSVVSHLQNVASSILLPGFLSTRATLSIPQLQTIPSEVELSDSQKLLPPSSRPEQITEGGEDIDAPSSPTGGRRTSDAKAGRRRASTTASTSGRARGSSLTGGGGRPRRGSTATYVSLSHDDPLDAHVVDVLTKRQKVKRALKGLGKFLMTPLGVFFFFYGIAVVFWGAAIVFFLAKWIPVKDKYTNDLWVEISSQVVNGLFTITGVGLFPQRLLDTYRIFTIWRLQRLTLKRMRAQNLPCPSNPDDLPDPTLDKDFVQVLSDKQQKQLLYQQAKFSASQTWYRPHETETHRAFPINLALLNTLFMSLNSWFQCMLCGTMWGLSAYSDGRVLLRMGSLKERPPWTTGCLIPLSFLCGIAAGVIVWKGGQKTKKVAEVEEKLKGALGITEIPEEVSSDGDEKHFDEEARTGTPKALLGTASGRRRSSTAASTKLQQAQAQAAVNASHRPIELQEQSRPDGASDGKDGTATTASSGADAPSLRADRRSFDERDEEPEASDIVSGLKGTI